jgi:Protein of unknown function (DUF2442)
MTAPKVVRVDDAAYQAALRSGERQVASRGAARKVGYDESADAIVVSFNGGAVLSIPRDRIPELAAIAPAALRFVHVSPLGDALQLERSDVDISLAGLLMRAFGEEMFARSLGRKGGAMKTPAKAAAARTNGAKGGRPRRPQAASHTD